MQLTKKTGINRNMKKKKQIFSNNQKQKRNLDVTSKAKLNKFEEFSVGCQHNKNINYYHISDAS